MTARLNKQAPYAQLADVYIQLRRLEFPKIRALGFAAVAVAAIKHRERVLRAPPLLSQEWPRIETWCHIAVDVALRNPDAIYDVY
ncbi:Uncharacterized protein TPAR_04858 [Tolypocladium paradoxum]|uniref:Uncharacterized protein n=1 Tax=Tolypocladium paradoxum TaxID=94208 RepID=A0A2S4KXL9_9HYPO|nr:Uncharacterized protein TPAR_04858 [Tolypocladium paradoxum]